ncbi:pre translocase subunit, partial [Brachionus plicatilis]
RVFSEETFENKVALAALGEIVNNESHAARADLVICSSIKQVYSIENEIKKEAKRAKINPKILKYRDEKDSHVTEQELKPGTILIATNISGRGTDLKTSTELERNGGLHVILAYMARNCRVQDQAMGRTARQGNQGSGQNLISSKEITDLVDSEEIVVILNP